MTTECMTTIIQAFRTRRDYYANLLDQSKRQQEFIDNADYTQLLALLGQKQQILSRLDELNQQQPGLMDDWKAQRDNIEAATRSDVEHLLEEIESIIKQLMQEEQSSTQTLIVQRDQTEKQIQDVTTGANVNNAYRDQLAPTTHKHLNLET